ncbi:hypothetical protein [Acinetobacter baumannii]|uniref:hypothetical protein n=1 Tax=Acinetobacter baumannii TaxID=470 RepID=UPI0036725B22
MKGFIKASSLEEANKILMCYQDVLKAMGKIQKGEEPPPWFSTRVGTCINVELAAFANYGIGVNNLDDWQRSVVHPDQDICVGESKLDYILNKAWIDFVNTMGNTVGYVEPNSSNVYPIIREYPDYTAAYSYANSVALRTLYKGKQLEARVSLVNFKCQVLREELLNIWKLSK